MGMHISQYLTEHNLSQAQFGAIIGVSQATVERYVNGKRMPAPEVMKRIREATAGNVQPNDFYDVPAPPGAAPNGKHRSEAAP